MTEFLSSNEPEWSGVPAWLRGGFEGLKQMKQLTAAGFTDQEAGRVALHICGLGLDDRTAYCADLRFVLKAAAKEKTLDD